MSPNVPLWSALTETDDRAGAQASVLTLLSVSKTRGVVRYSSLFPERVARANTLTNYKIAKCDDIVLNKMSAASGAVGVANENGLVSPDYAVFRVRSENEPRYLNHLLRSDWILSQVEVSLRGIGTGDSQNVRTPRIAIRDYLSLRAPLPDLPTQRRIADYLDRETAQFDAMAQALDGLVARLEERYARVVEGGTRLDIPHLPLGYCASIYNGSTPSRSRTDFWRDTPGVAWLNSSAVNQVPVTCPSRYVTNTAISECHLPEVRRGDLLMGITGQGRTRGMVSISSIPGTISQHVASIRLNERAHPRFMFWVLKSHYETIRMNSEGSGSTKGAVTLDEIKRISVPLPPLDEQRRIADYLDAETAKIDAMIAKAGELRALLDERRSALITATVTGQHPVPEEP